MHQLACQTDSLHGRQDRYAHSQHNKLHRVRYENLVLASKYAGFRSRPGISIITIKSDEQLSKACCIGLFGTKYIDGQISQKDPTDFLALLDNHRITWKL